jgi:Xaa-Pro dipeptidase
MQTIYTGNAMNSFSSRMKKIFKNAKADVIILMNSEHHDSNFFYLSGFTSGDFEQQILIVTKNKMILPVNELEYEIAKEQRPKEMQIIKTNSRKHINSILSKYMKNKTVGFNASFLPYRYYKYLKKVGKPKMMIDESLAFYDARAVKDKSELDNIKIANRIAKKALEKARKELKIHATEKEVAGKLEYFMKELGANDIAFKTIVSFNKNAALPHHMPDDTKLEKNSIVLIDMGAKYNNYCSDITRTFMFQPQKNSERYKKFTEIYNIVSEAQKLAYKKIKENVVGSAVHEIAANHIDDARNGKYKGTFIHSLGHAVGLDVHDMGPGMGYGVKEKLKANMVVSDEPGIYVVGFGGVRIEDDIIVTKKGAIMI